MTIIIIIKYHSDTSEMTENIHNSSNIQIKQMKHMMVELIKAHSC